MMVEGIFTSLYVGVQALLCQPNIWHHHFCLGISLSNEDNVHYDPQQQALNTDSIAEAESLFFFLLGILTYIGTQIHQHLKFLYSLRVYCYVLVSVSSHICRLFIFHSGTSCLSHSNSQRPLHRLRLGKNWRRWLSLEQVVSSVT